MSRDRKVYSKKSKVIRFLIWIMLLFVAMLYIFPVLYVLLGSFKANKELLVGGVNIFPTEWHWENYVSAWEKANFLQYTKNSLFLGVGAMVTSVILCTMSGYVFSRGDFPGKKLVYSVFLSFMFISVGSMSLRPVYELAINLNVHKSLWAVVIISAGSAQGTFIFLTKGFVDSIPRELDEAAKLDGASFFQTFYMIILPLLKPLISTISLLAFKRGWNDYILPRIFTVSNDSMRPLTVGLTMLKESGDGAARWDIVFAGATISIVPMVLMYCFFSKYFMKETTSGSVKG